MIERARRAFQAYVELGPERTLAKVSQLFAERGKPVSLVTLKRWSSRFCWQTIIRQQEQIVARAFCRRTAALAAANIEPPTHDVLKMLRKDLMVRLGTISSLREKFAERLDLSTGDPDAIRLTPTQFLKVCREELLLFERLKRLHAAENPEDVSHHNGQ